MRPRFLELFFAALTLAAWRAEAIESAPTVVVMLSSPSADLTANRPQDAEVGFNVFIRATGKRVTGRSLLPNTPSATLNLPPNTELLVRGFQASSSAGRLKFCMAEGYLTFTPEARYSWTFEYRPDDVNPTGTVCRSSVARLSDTGDVVESIELSTRAIEDKSK
jgi:hypothetical protein